MLKNVIITARNVVFFIFIAFFLFNFFARQSNFFSVKAQNSPKSNIVVFLVDDLDEATFNQLLENGKLPNIKNYILDKGVRFTNSFVTDSICCASRATFLTGKYPHNTGVYNVWGWEGGLRGFTGLNDNIATWLKSAGYQTAHIGKFMNTFEYGNGGKPGWDYWRNITGYDSRPGMYPVVNKEGQVSWPDLYQAKYMSDSSTNFLNSVDNNSNFFMVLTPHSPHVAIPRWSLDYNGVFSSEVENLNLPLVGYNVFDPSDLDISSRKVVIKGPDQSGIYHVFQNDYKLSTSSWSGWVANATSDNSMFAGSGNRPIAAFSSFIYPDTPNTTRQQLFRGDKTSGYEGYQRDIVGSVVNSWSLVGKVDDIAPDTGNLPVVGFGATSLPGGIIMQYLLRGDTAHGFGLYSRVKINGNFTSWVKEAEGWDDNSGEGDIVEININYLGSGKIERQFVRKDVGQQKYVEYRQVFRNFYEDLPSNVLGDTTLKTIPNNNVISTFQDESDMFDSPLNKTAADLSGDAVSNIYWSSRVFADGNWPNFKPSQTFPVSLYGGKYPAGSLRAGGDPNGFTPLDQRFDLLSANFANFNNIDCSTKFSLICQTWPNLNNAVEGTTELSFLKRLQLDRLESMISVDVMVGQVVSSLQTKGALDNTLIIFTSDNGHFLGEYRLGNKVYPYEDSIRVPLIIRSPNSTLTSEKINTNTVVNLDLAPTMLDYSGLTWDSSTYNVDGRSLKPLITANNDFISNWRKWFLTEYHFPRAQDKKSPDLTTINNPSWYFATAIPDLNALRVGNEAEKLEGKNSIFVNYYDDPLKKSKTPYYEYYDMNVDPKQTNNLYSNSNDTINSAYQTKMENAKNIIAMYKTCVGAQCRDIDVKKTLNLDLFNLSNLILKFNQNVSNVAPSDSDGSTKINSLDFATLLSNFGQVSSLSAVSQIAGYDQTQGDAETGGVPKLSILSGDGRTIYYKFSPSSGWDSSFGLMQVFGIDSLGQTAIRAFNQAVDTNGSPRQTVLSLDGKTYWIRYWNSGSWGNFAGHSVSDLNLPNDEAKISYFNMTQGDSETKDATTGLVRPKMIVVSADGTRSYFKFFNTGGSNKWDTSWTTISVAPLLNPIGVTTVRSFSQTFAPIGKPKQTALSVDGKTYWIRYFDQSAGWGTWQAYSSNDLIINAADTTVLPMP